MDISDVLSRAANALQYSTSSKLKFLVSIVGAMLVLALAYSSLYDFLYPRIFDVEHSRYGIPFWVGFGLVVVALPLGNGVAAILKSRAATRAFPPAIFGVAIAPFEVTSLDPDTLGAPATLQGLGRVMDQYFVSAERTINAEDWSKDFEFRHLPDYERITKSQQAETIRTQMSATLIIWGEIVQAINQPLRVVMHFLGTKVDLTLEGKFDPFAVTQMLTFFTLLAAAFSLQGRGLLPDAKDMFILARGPAARLDASTTSKGMSNAELVEDFIAKVGAPAVKAT